MAKEINYSKRKTVWSICLTLFIVVLCLAIIVVAFPLSTYIPRAGIDGTDYESDSVKANALIQQDVLIVAHRGGSTVAPENTMMAFKNLVATYGTDLAVELDVRLTKDGNLVINHDANLVRTSDSTDKDYLIADHTVAELKNFNMGYDFLQDGKFVYRNADEETLKDLRIVTLNEALAYFKSAAQAMGKTIQDFTFYIDIKESADRGIIIADKVYNALRAYNVLGNTVVEAFSDSVARYIDDNINTPSVKAEKRLTRAASNYEIWQFYFSCMFNLDLSKKNVKYKVLSLPYQDYKVNFAKKPIVDYAHKYGIAVNYWTVNDIVMMAYADSIGADAVITDNINEATRLLK